MNNLLRTKPCIADRVPFAQFEQTVLGQMGKREDEHKEQVEKLDEMKGMIVEMQAKEKLFKTWMTVVTAIVILASAAASIMIAILNHAHVAGK